MTQHQPPQTPEPQPAPARARNRRWVGPVVFLTLIVTPVLILIFSNTESRRVEFAWWEWNAPLWVILVVTFVAGAVVTRAAAWAMRTMRKRRKKAAE
jgi:uncharacterized integral membrane protein